jgi:hypothetical protein
MFIRKPVGDSAVGPDNRSETECKIAILSSFVGQEVSLEWNRELSCGFVGDHGPHIPNVGSLIKERGSVSIVINVIANERIVGSSKKQERAEGYISEGHNFGIVAERHIDPRLAISIPCGCIFVIL